MHHNDNNNKRYHVTRHSLEIKFIVVMSNIIFFPKSSTYVPTTADSEKWLLPTKGLPYFFGRNDSFRSLRHSKWHASSQNRCMHRWKMTIVWICAEVWRIVSRWKNIFSILYQFFFFKYLDKSYLRRGRLYSFVLNNTHSFLKIKSLIAKQINISFLVLFQ